MQWRQPTWPWKRPISLLVAGRSMETEALLPDEVLGPDASPDIHAPWVLADGDPLGVWPRHATPMRSPIDSRRKDRKPVLQAA